MGQLQKLTKQHVDEIYRLAATGKGSTEIAAGLEEGLVTDSGTRLSCVRITPAGVRHHLNQPKAETAIREWRQQLYGDIYAEPLAWSGCRVQELANRTAQRPRTRWQRPAGRTSACTGLNDRDHKTVRIEAGWNDRFRVPSAATSG